MGLVGIRQMMKMLLVLNLVIFAASSSFAQTPTSSSRPSASGPRKHLATILFAGLGGAVLGLSTLSFYGRPQEKLNNIAIGFAFGVIAGTGYVTYKAATAPSEFYGSPQSQLELEMEKIKPIAQQPAPYMPSFGFEF
ncbi:MAG TPA: hypothetical protein VM432_09185 [Bdellovibrionales bacterium]|nr:hypothetical protein [Bdellovibrionales bacterium]